MTAAALLDALRGDLAELDAAIRGHRYLAALEAGDVPGDSLRAFAHEQRHVIRSDRRSFAHLAARFPDRTSGQFFLDLADGEGLALDQLALLAGRLGLDEEAFAAYEPRPGCQAYPAYVAWLALNGSRADVALAFLANLDAWGEACGRARDALAPRLGDEAVGFFDFFATPPPDFEERALAVVQAGLDAGESPQHARRAARLLQAYELLYWDTIAETA